MGTIGNRAAALMLGIGTPNAVAGMPQQIRTERAGASFWKFGEELSVSDYKDNDGYAARAYLMGAAAVGQAVSVWRAPPWNLPCYRVCARIVAIGFVCVT